MVEFGEEILDNDICCYNCKYMNYMEVTGVPEEFCSKTNDFTNSWNRCGKFENRWKQ